MSIAISRHFATVGARQVHYRRAGIGPVVLLLHQSPLSSRDLLPMMRKLSATHTVIAPDMPGYGASDPVLDQPVTMDLLADNVAALMDVLGIAAAAFYGFHTGASLATAFARRHPQRVVVVIAEGLLSLDEPARRDLLANYLLPFTPSWDGAHLAWLWSRIKDQSIFFPWYNRTEAARLAIDGATPAVLAVNAQEWLRSGDHYRSAYAAALSYQPEVDVAVIKTPHHIIGRQGDPVAQQIQQWSSLGANFHIQLYANARETEAGVAGILQQYATRAAAPAARSATPLANRPWQDYLQIGNQQLRIIRAGDQSDAVTIVQHGAQSSLQACMELISGLAQRRSVLAIELPGHGESEAGDTDVNIKHVAQLMHEALQTLGVTNGDLIGIAAGGAIQIELMAAHEFKARSLTLINAIDVTADKALQTAMLDSYQPIEHDSHGGYLLRAWHQARDHLLFFPWYERHRVHAMNGMPMLDQEILQRRMVDLILAGSVGNSLCHAELRYPLRQRLHSLPLAPRFAAPNWEPRFGHTQQLTSKSEAFISLPREWRAAAALL